MNYVIFDLEWNRHSRTLQEKCPDEVIQIGAVKYDAQLRYSGSFSCMIRPQIYRRLEPTVEKMTGLTIGKLDREGVPFVEAFDAFRSFMGHKFVLMSWGMQDPSVLRANCHYYDERAKLDFLSRFADLQRFASEQLSVDGKQQQIGLSAAADCFPIPYEEESLHDALVDAAISGEVFVRIFDKKKFSRYIVDAREINQHYKNIHITDLSHKAVDKRQFRMHCPSCGRCLKRTGPWTKQGYKFAAEHVCSRCGTCLIGSVEILLTYGSEVKYKKRLRLPDNSLPSETGGQTQPKTQN